MTPTTNSRLGYIISAIKDKRPLSLSPIHYNSEEELETQQAESNPRPITRSREETSTQSSLSRFLPRSF